MWRRSIELDSLEGADYHLRHGIMEEPMTLKGAGRLVLILLFGSMLAACGNTWSGMKEDTGENMEAVGERMDSTGAEMDESGEEEQKTQ
jgi:predicted small secreted protein